jgi:hypothetical protein
LRVKRCVQYGPFNREGVAMLGRATAGSSASLGGTRLALEWPEP